MRCWTKILCAVLSMLLCATVAGATDDKTFDFSALESLEGYEEDAFDKTESCRTMVLGRTLSWLIVVPSAGDGKLEPIGLIMFGDDLYESLEFLIGETVYAFDLSAYEAMGIEGTAILLSESSLEFFEALTEAEELSIRATRDGDEYEDTYFAEDLQPVQELLEISLSQDPIACYNNQALEMIEFTEMMDLQEMEIR